MLHEIALYEFTIDIDIDCTGVISNDTFIQLLLLTLSVAIAE